MLKGGVGIRPRAYLFFITAALLCVIHGPVSLSAAQVTAAAAPIIAPVNPAFLDYMQKPHPGGPYRTPDGYSLGYVPSPVDLSYLAGKALSVTGHRVMGIYPAQYDLRTLGKVSSVKDQGSCGDCWAFATYGSLESNLLTGELWDFYEDHLNNNNGFDPAPCNGGNGNMSTSYLARWSGPVNQGDASFVVQKHVQDVLYIPDRASALDNDNIKLALSTYGAVYTTYYASSTYYHKPCPSGTCTTYYYFGSATSNHAVTIVGWDDNFPYTSFTPAAPGNGAFILKNSWGTGWGDSGYFYISYYDTNVGRDNFVFAAAQPITNYNRAYQYDPLGFTANFGYGSTTAWFANVFTATATEQLLAVSFHTLDVNTAYTVNVYTNVTSGPTSGVLNGGAATTGVIAIPGYHTITLNSPVGLASGQKFSVVVKVTGPLAGLPIAMEYPVGGYSSTATAGPGQSYVSSNGATWDDLTASYPNTNVCLKAFAGTPPVSITVATSPSGRQVSVDSVFYAAPHTFAWGQGSPHTLDVPSPQAGGPGIQYIFSSWSDAGAQGHTITTPSSPSTYTAGFSTQYQLTTVVSPAGAGTINPNCSSGCWYNSGASPSLNALSNAGYAFSSWSGDCAGVVSPATVTMNAPKTCVANFAPAITVATSPAGLNLTVDSATSAAPVISNWTAGSPHTLDVPSPQAGGPGIQYIFSSWSDAGAQGHTITTPSSPSTYTAGFSTQYQLTTVVSPAASGTVGANCSGGCWYDSGATALMNAVPASGHVFGSWSPACGSGSNIAASATMNAPKSCTATFSACGDHAKVASSGLSYLTIGGAGNAYANAQNPDTIQLIATSFSEALDLNRNDNIMVTLSGGYGCGYAAPASYSFILGSLTISKGTVIIDHIIIQ